MAWLVVAAGGVGCLLGLWLVRVPCIALISFAFILVCGGNAPYAQWGLWATFWFTLAFISALQAGYLAGLFASVAWMRASAPHKILRSSHNDQRSM